MFDAVAAPILFSREDFQIANTVGQVKDWGRSNGYNLHISIHKEQKKFEHGGLLACRGVIKHSNLLSRRLGLISCLRCLQHLLPAQPFVVWGEIPTYNTEHGNRTEDYTSLVL